MKYQFPFSVRHPIINFTRSLRMMFLLSLLLLTAAAMMWTETISGGRAAAKTHQPKGEMMMKVLDKNGESKVVRLPSTRPQIDESVFDGTAPQTGYYRGQRVQFLVRDGWAIVDGDIAIGRAADLRGETDSISFAQYKRMWLKVGGVFKIPYVVTNGNSNIPIAVNYFNTTFAGVIQWVPRMAEADYVDFNLTTGDFSGYGFSSVGRTGFGSQQLGGAINQNVGTLLHEMGHAVGLYHEQSRADRNTYIEFHPENMSNSVRSNAYQLADYFQLDGDIQDIGRYDYASTMHYYWNNLAKNDAAVFESIPHGIQLARYPPNETTGDYSEGDIDGIKRLYDAAPSAITITSNPVGLQVIVDGATVTTPQTYNWALNSTHTLSVPANGQTLGSKAFVYGRWNDSTAATHNITVTPGDGRRVSPPGKPATTVYSANFINLIKFTQGVFPAATGSMTAMPAPQSYTGLTGLYYVARQPVTLQATPNSGQNFYAWFGVPLYSFSRNPQTFRWDVDVAEVNAEAGFTNQPIYTFTTNLPDNRLGVFIDGGFWYAPVSFSPFYDGAAAWAAGTTHTLDTFSPQYPFYFNTRHQFQNWSDGGAQLHNITLPAVNTSYAANFNTQYTAIVNSPCGGTPSVSPVSADGYYNAGTSVTVSQTPDAGYVFTGWREDLSGTISPLTLTLNGELYAVAKYNVNAAPFSMTSLNPSSVAQNSAGFTLTINGTGFTPTRTFAYVNDQFRANTFINSTQITVPVLASDLTTAGAISIFVQNFPDGATCGVYNNRILNVTLSNPTAASVSVGGRVLTARGRGIFRARISMIDSSGTQRSVYTNPFGYYNFGDVPAGETYVFSVSHRRYNFAAQVLSLVEERDDVNFVALP